jgi:hypothetical protein
MKKAVSAFLAVMLLAGLFVFTGSSSATAKVANLLEWNTMAGVPKAYTGAKAPIRGINGGGLPWVLASGFGELSPSGKLEVKVFGLVLDPNDPAVIAAGRAGMNPIATFRAIVSCQTVDANGSAVVANVMTDPFPATVGLASAGGGNASIETTLSLPKPCIAPIVFVTSPAGAWFAATGQ